MCSVLRSIFLTSFGLGVPGFKIQVPPHSFLSPGRVSGSGLRYIHFFLTFYFEIFLDFQGKVTKIDSESSQILCAQLPPMPVSYLT